MNKPVKWMRRGALFLAGALCVGGVGASVLFYENWSEEAAEQAIVLEPEREKSSAVSAEPPVPFEALLEENADVKAWLEIPGTGISYPVVQAADNETYLHRDFHGDENAAGSIFLDYASDPDCKGAHSVFYGHHMRNGSMFAELVRFKEKDYFEDHREITLYLPEETLYLRTIGTVVSDSSGVRRRTDFASKEELTAYAEVMTENCLFRELPEEEIESLYSFVTCSYEFEDARTILYAVREPESGVAEGKRQDADMK
ncbi:MAG: class B sortase [Clostridium sp.]